MVIEDTRLTHRRRQQHDDDGKENNSLQCSDIPSGVRTVGSSRPLDSTPIIQINRTIIHQITDAASHLDGTLKTVSLIVTFWRPSLMRMVATVSVSTCRQLKGISMPSGTR